MSDSLFPTPILEFEGASAQLQPSMLVLGTATVGTVSGQTAGFNCSSEIKDDTPYFRIRPARAYRFMDVPPCNYVVDFEYRQNGIEWDMVFTLISDNAGGVVGTAAAVEVDSNYPELPMTLNKFVFAQPGVGVQSRAVLPEDYVAQIRLKFWIEDADPALDGWIRLETNYVKPGSGSRPVLVNTGRALFFPASGEFASRVLGIVED
ncbi:hypothetical protein AAB988_31800 [Burkholderia contaminans]|uniref:hypothetical protein n=1 Tax=Burkholderia contaminans TaxID=488447 RepID=UPI003118B7BB